MSNFHSIIELIESINSHPLRWEVITLESVLSLPTLISEDGLTKVLFFFYPIGGPIDQRVIWSPYYRVIGSVGTDKKIEFSPIQPEELEPKISISEPLGLEEESSFSRDEYDDQLESLYTKLEQIISFYPTEIEELNRTQRQAVTAFHQLFHTLVDKPVLPAYQLLNPAFFDWIAASPST
jgi:hypothetical protein